MNNDIIKNILGKIDIDKISTANYAAAQNIHDKTFENMENLKKQFEADEDCPYFDLCSTMNISEDKICSKGGNIKSRCTFGESKIILLLSRLNFN